jgi:hypothetical protein
MNIISKEELMTLNQRNEDLKLKDDNIEYFLNVQLKDKAAGMDDFRSL